jgi:hypothetical protein
MKFQAGDKVKYIGNVAFDGRMELFQNVVGTVSGYYFPRGSIWTEVVNCNWRTEKGYAFQWNVPESYIKKIRQGE